MNDILNSAYSKDIEPSMLVEQDELDNAEDNASE